MISIQEAQALVLSKTPTRRRVSRRSIEGAVGHVLAEDLIARTDLPPFDRVTKDGFALRCADVQQVPYVFPVSGEVTAGENGEGNRVGEGELFQVSTGAILPEGADTVIPADNTETAEDGRVMIKVRPKVGDHIAFKAQDMEEGRLALGRGTPVNVTTVGLMASLGYREVRVFDAPEVAIVSTGNELVEPGKPLRPGLICDANRYVLAAQVSAAHGAPRLLGAAPDDADAMADMVEQGLLSDMLVITGGSSIGRYDLAHEVVIDRLGCERHFNGVAIYPGAATVFCTQGERLVFCLPGNPVSAFVTFELFVRPALERRAGLSEGSERLLTAELAAPLRSPSDQSLAQLAELTNRDGRLVATPVEWRGSGDQVALSLADGFVILEPDQSCKPGDLVRVLATRSWVDRPRRQLSGR